MLNANSLFTAHFDKITVELPFKLEYNNGTGYFNALVYDIPELATLPVGEMAKCYTGDVNRRRIIIMKTQFGNVVIFDRYTDNVTADSPVFVLNTPSTLQNLQLLHEGAQSYDQMSALLGNATYPDLDLSLAKRLIKLQAVFAKIGAPVAV
jgi:hypothetical protein